MKRKTCLLIIACSLRAQKLTLLFPTRHFVAAMRSLYLKGTSVSELGGVYLALSALAAAFCLLAALTYRKRQG